MAEKRATRKIVKRQSVEEKILGVEPEIIDTKEIDYENSSQKYKVTGLHEGATPVFINGTVIEAFIGSTNRVAREALIAGALEVITKDGNGKDAYKIEVIK